MILIILLPSYFNMVISMSKLLKTVICVLHWIVIIIIIIILNCISDISVCFLYAFSWWESILLIFNCNLHSLEIFGLKPNWYLIWDLYSGCTIGTTPGPTFIKPDQRNPWIKDQLGNDLLSTILHIQLPNFVSCGRDKPSHMTQNLVTVGAKL